MENKIIETIKTIFVAVALTIGLTAVGFAQKAQKAETVKDFHQAVEEFSRRSEQNAVKISPKSLNSLSAKGVSVPTVSQTNFNIGTEFVVASLYAIILDDDIDASEDLIAELNHLIDYLEAEPEAAGLRKALKSVTQKTATSDQVLRELDKASKSYSSRLSGEQKWYFNSGYTVMNLMISAYIGDDELMKAGLAEVQALIKTAPRGTSAGILTPMNDLVKYIAKTTYSKNDYNAIFEGAVGVIDSVNA